VGETFAALLQSLPKVICLDDALGVKALANLVSVDNACCTLNFLRGIIFLACEPRAGLLGRTCMLAITANLTAAAQQVWEQLQWRQAATSVAQTLSKVTTTPWWEGPTFDLVPTAPTGRPPLVPLAA
jgi:hypothetical protein